MIPVIRRAWSITAALALCSALSVTVTGCTDERVEASDGAQTQSLVREAPGPAAVQPARGGRHLLRATEASKLAVVGRVSGIEKIDLHGYAADLRVDQALSGAVKPGAVLRIAWEELAPSRPVRFSERERVLVCLNPAPDYTLWQKRFPNNLANILAVAQAGEAFLRDPDSETLHLLKHYLALGKDARDDPAALAYLASLVGTAPESLAINVLESLDRRSGIAAKLTESAISALVKAAVDGSRPDSVRRGVLLLIGRARIHGARAGINPLTQPGKAFRAEALDTVGKLDGGLSAALVSRMLVDEDGNVRAVAAQYLRAEDARETLVSLAMTDPAPRVRIVAVRRLLDEHGEEVLDDIATGLGDEDPTARMVFARGIAKLGDDVVPQLEELADSGSERQAEGVVLAFTFMGDAGGKALVRLHKEHKSKNVRALAGLALGRMPSGDSH